MSAIRTADPLITTRVAAIDEPNAVRAYGSEVRWRIRQGTPQSFRYAADAINASNIDAVVVQHEFGLFGVWPAGWETGIYDDHLRYFFETLHKPVVTTLHTVLPNPSPSLRDTVRTIAESSQEVVVMAETAIGLLDLDYGINTKPTLIPHGMPVFEASGRRNVKARLGLEGRQIICTFGFVDRRKGLEYMIEAMGDVVHKHPDVLYLIAGQTHPDVLRAVGEEYRNELIATINKMGLADHVAFMDQYLTQREIIDYLIASDIYVTPYLDPNQITSGTLSYALGAGKAIISTPYLHAAEALADDRGILVDYRDSKALADALNRVLGDPALKARLERGSFEYAKEMTWPNAGRRYAELIRDMVKAMPRAQERATAGRRITKELATRLPENPLITSNDVAPSRHGVEVISAFNAGVTVVDDEVVMLLRVVERPRQDRTIPTGAKSLDFDGSIPRLRPLPAGIGREKLLGVPFLDTHQDPGRIITAYLRQDTPGLDLSDPHSVRFRSNTGGFSSPLYDFNDLPKQTSHLRVARSTDCGVTFAIEPGIAIGPESKLEEYGCEDPRITLLDGTFYITYVAASRMGMATSLATTKDFRSFTREGMIFLPDHKDVVIFPEKIGGRYVALTRPMPSSFSRMHGIWIAFSDDITHWGDHQVLAMPRPAMWDELRTGASCVPFRVPGGWLEIYHGVDRHRRYTLGALLLSPDDPTKVLGRSPRPILVPTEPYERVGFLDDVVFSGGHVALDADNERIRVYYGAADTCLAAADFSTRDIVDSLEYD